MRRNEKKRSNYLNPLKMKNIFGLILPVIFLFAFTACDEDEDPGGLSAIAGLDREVEVGETVQLDGSESLDITGEGYNAQWSFVSIPEGSAATISNANSVTASFIPDVPGDYVVELTISNNVGQSSDQVTITALPATVTLSGSYNEDLHLTKMIDEPGVADYVVTGGVDIYAKLTIDPGVRIEVMDDRRIRIRTDGVIEANGTESEPIIITGQQEIPGYWRGIYFQSTNLENTMNNVHISGAGSDNMVGTSPRTAFYISDGRINLNHCHFTDNQGYGLAVSGSNSQFPMNQCAFSGNSSSAILVGTTNIGYIDNQSDFNGQDVRVGGGSMGEDVTQTWPNLMNGYYRVEGDMDVYGEVTIEEGAEFRFGNDVRFRLRGSSVLKAMGTAQNPIIFKGTVEAPGAWRGVYAQSTSLENEINHVHFAHAGHSSLLGTFGRAALGLDGGSRYSINNAAFSDINGYGIRINSSDANISLDGLQFGNNISQGAIRFLINQVSAVDTQSDFGGNPIEVNGGTLASSEDVTWVNPNNGVYLFSSNAETYGKITIEPGTRLEFENDIRFRVRQDAVLIANGNAGEMITFTRKTGSGAHWRGIYLQSSSMENSMDYVEISYAGNSSLLGSFGQANLGITSEARMEITNSDISNSLGWGIINNGTLIESGNNFSNNASGDIDQ